MTFMSAEAAIRKIKVYVKRRLEESNANKGYDSAAFRRHLIARGTRSNIPKRQRRGKRRQRGSHPHYDKATAKFRTFTHQCLAQVLPQVTLPLGVKEVSVSGDG